MVEERMPSPKVDGFRMKVKLEGKFSDVARALNSISFLKIAKEKEGVNVAYVESRSIDKTPYLFSMMKFKKNEIEVVYTVPNNVSPTKRKLDVMRYLLNMITLVEPYYEIDSYTKLLAPFDGPINRFHFNLDNRVVDGQVLPLKLLRASSGTWLGDFYITNLRIKYKED